MLEEKKKEVLRACNDLVDYGHTQNTGVAGNVSYRDPEKDLVVATPSQLRYDTLEAGDMVVVDMEGEVVDGKEGMKPTSELSTHLEIYRQLEDVNAVVHSHPMYSNSLGLVLDEIPPVSGTHGYFFGDAIPVVSYVMAGTEEMAEEVASNLAGSPGLVIRNHGIVVTGGDVSEALTRALEMENNSEMYYKAKTLGMGEPEPLDKKTIEKLQEVYKSH